MTTEHLAKQTLKVLELQAEYFQSRSPTKLAECRDAERRLKEACLEVLNPTGPGLFDKEGGDL